MDSGWAAVLGALIGGGSTFAGTIVAEWLRQRRDNRLNEIRKTRLKSILEMEKFKWRSLSMLRDAIGADEETTVALLLEIGARRSMAGRDSWGLVSRNPFPDSDTDGER